MRSETRRAIWLSTPMILLILVNNIILGYGTIGYFVAGVLGWLIGFGLYRLFNKK